MPKGDFKLEDSLILFDRDIGLSFFRNFRGYNDLIDDAEWLLERTQEKSRGFILRPVIKDKHKGLWIGQYNHENNKISSQGLIFDNDASTLSKIISDYGDSRISEKSLEKKITLAVLKKKVKTRIIQDFKYFICPPDLFYRSCIHVDKVYEELIRKYGKGKKILYSQVAEEIAKVKPCEDVIVCPLMVPNLFERVLNLSKALKSRRLGEIHIITSNIVEII